jgi:ribosomal protein S30
MEQPINRLKKRFEYQKQTRTASQARAASA